MKKFNQQEVSKFIASQSYEIFEYQVRGLIAKEFGVTLKTAGKWATKLIQQGKIKTRGKRAIALI